MSVAGFTRARTAGADDSSGSTSGNEAPTLAAVKLALRIDEDDSDDQLTRNIEAATQRADRQAPDAPTATRTEAVIRYVAWLYEGPMAYGSISEAGAWRRCGAESLLAPWTVRRGGVIG